tara:strand:+ start:9621 stop:10964 length:1344 start_codon:yes stop_codon:yes gene_type:complete
MERIIELIIDEENEFSGIEAISVVENPAIEEDFIALKEHKEVKLAEVDKEKRILMGAALIPNKKIYRKGDEEDYYIFFSEDTVRKASELFLMKGNQNNSTLEHNIELKGMSVVESWIIEDEKRDKSRKYDFDLPVGTWMVSMKVNNDEVWNQVKAGEVKGFSIEGYFADKMDGPKESLPESLCSECLDELNAEYELLEALESLSEEVELESYGGYPESASNNAKLGIKRNKELGNKCATQVGKVRGQQLARKEKFTKSTLKRIYSYLSRAAEYYDPKKPDACGTISYLLWGGKSMLNWTESKLNALEAAKVGPKGGITKSPKAPKSGTPNKNPKGKGSAKGNAKGKTGAKVSAKDRATLQNKADDFNKRYKEKLGYGVTVGMLASVFQRGLGAFNTSHSPNVKSASQWAFARTNAFLYLVKNGRPQNAKYTTDYDLLPKKHPKSSKK